MAPQFSADERAAVDLSYRYTIAQIELATDVIFKRSARLKALFERAAETGILLGGADRTVHLFGCRITHRYPGRLETVLDRRNEGHPTLRSYYQTSFVKQYEQADRLLRTETCLNDTYHLAVGRRVENLPVLHERMAATNLRYLERQAELLASNSATTRGYRLTRLGLKLGVLLVKLRQRLLGPLATLVTQRAPTPQTRNPSQVQAAFRQVTLPPRVGGDCPSTQMANGAGS